MARCPECGSREIYGEESGGYDCGKCGYHFDYSDGYDFWNAEDERCSVLNEDDQQDEAETRCPECAGELGTGVDFCTTCQRHAGVYHAEGW